MEFPERWQKVIKQNELYIYILFNKVLIYLNYYSSHLFTQKHTDLLTKAMQQKTKDI